MDDPSEDLDRELRENRIEAATEGHARRCSLTRQTGGPWGVLYPSGLDDIRLVSLVAWTAFSRTRTFPLLSLPDSLNTALRLTF